jgi:hypothetical protein
MKKIIAICILFIVTNSCHKKKDTPVLEDFLVNAEYIDTGNISSDNCSSDPDDYSYYRIVRIVVKNNCEVPKSFWIMKCDWQRSFVCDNEDFSFSVPDCDGNFPKKIELLPNHTITFNSILKQKLITKTHSVSQTLRIGLLMLDENDVQAHYLIAEKYRYNKKIYWSNPVIIKMITLGYSKQDDDL